MLRLRLRFRGSLFLSFVLEETTDSSNASGADFLPKDSFDFFILSAHTLIILESVEILWRRIAIVVKTQGIYSSCLL